MSALRILREEYKMTTPSGAFIESFQKRYSVHELGRYCKPCRNKKSREYYIKRKLRSKGE